MNEENVSVKISMPLIDNIELQRIDTFYNDIVSEYTKTFVKEKEQVITQRLMMNLQQENARLKNERKQIKEYVEKCNFDNAEILYDFGSEYCYIDNFKEHILEILKEN